MTTALIILSVVFTILNNSNTIYGNCKELKIYDLTGTLADDLLDSTIIELKILY